MAKTAKILAGVAAAAATTGLAALAAKKLRGSEAAFHVLRDDAGWAVIAEGSKRAASRHETKKAAVEAARDIVHARRPSRLVIHKQNGEIQRVHEYDAG